MSFVLAIRPYPDVPEDVRVPNHVGNGERDLVHGLPEYIGEAARRFRLLDELMQQRHPDDERHYDPRPMLAEVEALSRTLATTEWSLPFLEEDDGRWLNLTSWCRERGLNRCAESLAERGDWAHERDWYWIIHCSPPLKPRAQYVYCLSEVDVHDWENTWMVGCDPGPQCCLVGTPGLVHLVAGDSEKLCMATDWTVFPRITAREFRWEGTTLLADGKPCRDVPPSFNCPQITQRRVAARDVLLGAVFENELKHMREACELAIQHGYALYPSH